MKIGYQITSRSKSSEISAPDPQSEPDCRGRCYLPRIGASFSSRRLPPKIQPGFQGGRLRGDASFAADTKPGQGSLIRGIQLDPSKSKVKKFKQTARPKTSQICVTRLLERPRGEGGNLCNLWTNLPPLRSLRPLRLNQSRARKFRSQIQSGQIRANPKKSDQKSVRTPLQPRPKNTHFGTNEPIFTLESSPIVLKRTHFIHNQSWCLGGLVVNPNGQAQSSPVKPSQGTTE